MRNSSSKTSNRAIEPTELPKFKNEAEEAEWYHSPEGRRFMNRLASNRRTTPKRKHFDVKMTDPAALQALIDRAKSNQTKAISIRIANADLERAKRLAEKAGLRGYQTLIKDIIHEGLVRAENAKTSNLK